MTAFHRSPGRPLELADCEFAAARLFSGSVAVVKARNGQRGVLDDVGITCLAEEADVRPDEARSVLIALGILTPGVTT